MKVKTNIKAGPAKRPVDSEFGPGEQRYFFDVVMAKGRLGTCHAGRLGARPSGKTI